MSEHPFDKEAARLFGQAPGFDDDAAFAAAFQARLDRYARLRGRLVPVFVALSALAAGIVVIAMGAFDWLGEAFGVAASNVSSASVGVSPVAWTIAVVVMGAGALLYARSERLI